MSAALEVRERPGFAADTPKPLVVRDDRRVGVVQDEVSAGCHAGRDAFEVSPLSFDEDEVGAGGLGCGEREASGAGSVRPKFGVAGHGAGEEQGASAASVGDSRRVLRETKDVGGLVEGECRGERFVCGFGVGLDERAEHPPTKACSCQSEDRSVHGLEGYRRER